MYLERYALAFAQRRQQSRRERTVRIVGLVEVVHHGLPPG